MKKKCQNPKLTLSLIEISIPVRGLKIAIVAVNGISPAHTYRNAHETSKDYKETAH